MAKKILVIDDEPDVLVFLGTLLRKNGYEVCEAEDGVQGLKMVIDERPDLVCLDLLMPEKTGIKMYKRDAERRKTQRGAGNNGDGFFYLPIGYMDFKKFIHHRSIPAPEGYIEKPVNRDEFLKAVKEVLGE